jgi:hypothetical protein
LQLRGDPLDQFAGVAAVGLEVQDAGKRRDQKRQQGPGTIAILDVGGMDLNGQHQAELVDDEVALAPADLLGTIVGPVTT